MFKSKLPLCSSAASNAGGSWVNYSFCVLILCLRGSLLNFSVLWVTQNPEKPKYHYAKQNIPNPNVVYSTNEASICYYVHTPILLCTIPLALYLLYCSCQLSGIESRKILFSTMTRTSDMINQHHPSQSVSTVILLLFQKFLEAQHEKLRMEYTNLLQTIYQ